VEIVGVKEVEAWGVGVEWIDSIGPAHKAAAPNTPRFPPSPTNNTQHTHRVVVDRHVDPGAEHMLMVLRVHAGVDEDAKVGVVLVLARGEGVGGELSCELHLSLSVGVQ
jgi:hypothetical protein